MKLTANVKAGFGFLAFFSLVILISACDSVDDDLMPKGPTVTIEGDEVYVMPDGTAYIDLYSKVKTNAPVTVRIGSMPLNGSLVEYAKGLLRYSPDPNLTRGRDEFSFEVLAGGKSLLTDTVQIIIKDSVDLPCFIYPRDDFYPTAQFPAELRVLSNDLICADSADILLEIYKPDAGYPPLYGTATVTPHNTIIYNSNDAKASDRILYKVSRKSDPAVFGFGMAHIQPTDSCSRALAELSFQAHRDSTHYPITDSLLLDLPDSVYRCNKLFNDLRIKKGPAAGTISLAPSGFMYHYTITMEHKSISDSITYMLCREQDCLTGVARIKIN